MADFSGAKELFRDIVDISKYIPLPSSEKIKTDLLSAIAQKERMILLTGEAGSGKSLLLKSIYNQLKDKKDIFFISNPYLEIDSVLKVLKELDLQSHHIMFLDEAQLLTPNTWENLRIYADKGNITIVFATHDVNVKDLLSKKHFKTRINTIIPVKKITRDEMENFILTKLLKHNYNDIASMFTKSNFKLIYKHTGGSLRATNQVMYKLLDVLDYFYKKDPNKINLKKLHNKFIHIAVMDLKAIDA